MDRKYTVFVPYGFNNTGSVFFKIATQNKNKFLFSKLNNINWYKKPFFAMINERGTVKFFIDAINKNADDEAIFYVSKSLCGLIDLNEVRDLFNPDMDYKYLVSLNKEEQNNLSIVALAVHDNSGKNEIINVKMIEEPDVHGRWKIYEIERE